SQNTAAKQGLVLIAGKLVLQAREAMDNGQLDKAGELLRDARALDPQSSDLSASTRALETARRTQQAAAEAERQRAAEREAAAQRQEQLRQQEEAERLAQEAEADRLVEEERQSAARRAAELAAATAAAGSAGATQSGVAAAAGETTDAGTAAANLSARNVNEEASSPVAKAALTAAQTQAMRQAAAEESAAQASDTPADNELEWVAISALTRVNYVAPKYPRAAQRRNATGSVDVSFVVSTNGEVRNVEVLESTPGTIFDDAAMTAVSKWRFEPITENGLAVEKRSAVRLAFNLQ
ncbi:MAG: energy transducer TonB, partial [Gammaproteobacteria bacterium]|nr:energy transducer TonB [Gammaproteobacteria bacterium]